VGYTGIDFAPLPLSLVRPESPPFGFPVSFPPSPSNRSSNPTTAPTKAAGQDSVGYDIYDLWDLGEFDQKGGKPTKYGTKEELCRMIKTARDNGIVTYVDAVLNHKFGAEKTETFAVRFFPLRSYA
jgi:alpha-amylase